MNKYIILKAPKQSCFCGKESNTECNFGFVVEGCKFEKYNEDIKYFIIDMSERKFIDSNFCKNLIKNIVLQKKILYLVKCGGQPRQVLDILGLNKYIFYENSVTEAIIKIEREIQENNL
jgi:hypothetical protein